MPQTSSNDSEESLFDLLFASIPVAPAAFTIWRDFLGRITTPGECTFLSSGLPSIDRALGGGFVPGTLSYFASKRGTGKSLAIRQTLAHNASQGVEVAYLILEGSLDAQLCRMLAAFNPPTLLSIVRDHYNHRVAPRADEVAAYEKAADTMSQWPFALVNHLTSIELLTTYVAAHPNLRMLGVDQLQHLSPPKGMKRGMESVEANSSALRQLAIKHNLVILAASQINRPEGQAREKIYEPNEWSLRGSEQLAHDADNIFLLNRMKGGRVLKVTFDKVRDEDDACPPAYFKFQGVYSRLAEGDPLALATEYAREVESERKRKGISKAKAETETTIETETDPDKEVF